jgi:nitrogen fixation/metabolism regulation signal transduction histidine kinase
MKQIKGDQLLANSNRALELINALRARLKNPETGKTQTSIFDAHFHVIKFLEAQFQPDRFKRIQFKIDHRLENQRFELQRVDLIHILENLYRNSTLNLLENEVSEPFIWIREEQKDSEFTTLLISDNGSGLTSDRFEKLTAFRFAQQKTTLIHEGLGLRLTRRLVELNHGALSVIDSKKDLPGTTFRLKLKRHSEGFMHTSVHGASLELQSESLDH